MIQNIKWDAAQAEWEMDGQQYCIAAKDIFRVREDKENCRVDIYCGANHVVRQEYCCEYDARLLYKYDLTTEVVAWDLDGLRQVFPCSGLKKVDYDAEHEMILVLAVKSDKSFIMGINRQGDEIFCLAGPAGYEPLYFERLNGCPIIVCEGGARHADAYGRTRRNFFIRMPYGPLEAGPIAY